MNILDKIVLEKKSIVDASKKEISIDALEKSGYFLQKAYSFEEQLKLANGTGIIAEFKRQSPSKGAINKNANVEEVSKAYEDAGAVAISVLTDESFFGAEKNDFALARKTVQIPLLRKDFIIDEYQIIETKAMGADMLLLIGACLSKQEIKSFASLANSIGLQVLLEIHTEEELEMITEHCNFIGINNRNLKTFEVDLENSIRLANSLPKDKIKIAESGISEVETVLHLKKQGFDGFLMGENFMKTSDPGESCKTFIQQLKN
jgi:indole-3-glycerol phosphate synthase